jgi:hypothetical protein
VYSLLFLCAMLNLDTATFVIGISLKGLLVPESMIMSTSQWVGKKYAHPGYVTSLILAGGLIAWTSSLLEHSWSLSILGVMCTDSKSFACQQVVLLCLILLPKDTSTLCLDGEGCILQL